MVQYITRSTLSGLAKENYQENLRKVYRAQQRSVQNSTFLSHSSKDDDIVPAIVLILENHGASVYVDKLDESLNQKSSRQVAKQLRERVSACKKFVVIASNNVKDSKWVPWELGLADGCKFQNNVAIFPAPDKADDYKWTEQEYLGIYDRIVWGKIRGETDHHWLVYDHTKNTAVNLKKWLSQ